MRIAGVIDLLAGQAVHARAGERDRYAPVAMVAGDARALAARYADAGMTDLYVADLNALQGRPRHDVLVASLVEYGIPLWLDAGTTTVDTARDCLALGAARIIVALETLRSFDDLEAICGAIGGDRVAFSLDLRGGLPIVREPDGPPNLQRLRTIDQADANVVATARRAAAAGVSAMITLDLARVGTQTGLDVDTIRRVRAAVPSITLFAGGGVRGPEDIARLHTIGCDGALVATAFQHGSVDPTDIARLRNLEPRTPSAPLN